MIRMTSRSTIAALTLAAIGSFAPSARGQAARPVTEPLAGFDAYAAKALKDWDAPGFAVAVVHGDSVVFAKGYGVRTLGSAELVDEHTRFAIGSTTKAFISFSVMLMADSGKLNLETRVADRMPVLQLQPSYVSQELTIRDLLTHRSGMPNTDFLWYDTPYDFNEIARKMRLVKPETSMRSHFEYQNVTYAAAGFIAAMAAGEDWEAMVHGRILAPLGMAETYTNTNAAIAGGNIATPHFRIDDTVRVIDRYHTDNIGPAGAMYSSVADMSKWVRFLLDSARLGGKRMLSARHFAELWDQQMLVGPDGFYPTASLTHPNFTAYGLGWFLEDYRGERVVFHTGSIDGMVAIVGLIPARKLGIVVLANLDHTELRHALMYDVFDRYIGGGTHDWSAEMLKMYNGLHAQGEAFVAAEMKKRVMGTHPTLPLERYAGTYRDDLYGSLVVKIKDGKLSVDDPMDPCDLKHWNYDTFLLVHRKRWLGKDKLTFSFDAEGKVSGVTPGGGIVLARVPEAAK